jgi:glutaredoxin
MNDMIVVFTLNGCFHCDELKENLDKLSIPFHDIEITQNEKIWNKVVSQTGHNVLPTVFIPTDIEGNGTLYIPGRDFKDRSEIIEIIKKHI